MCGNNHLVSTISLTKWQFIITLIHSFTRDKKLDTVLIGEFKRGMQLTHSNFVSFYNIMTEGVFLTQLSRNEGHLI